MRRIRILLLLMGLTVSVLAQTNTEVRTLSLEDCLHIALEHNLDVQIKRYDPEISRFTLGVAYGIYDPTFATSGGHDYSQSAGGFDPPRAVGDHPAGQRLPPFGSRAMARAA